MVPAPPQATAPAEANHPRRFTINFSPTTRQKESPLGAAVGIGVRPGEAASAAARSAKRSRKGVVRGNSGKPVGGRGRAWPATTQLLSVPLVLGMPPSRSSRSTACRRAREVALKIASAMWWLLRP